GRYADTTDYFGHPRVSGPLTATAGVYRYGSQPGFPTETWRASTYYVDLAFRPDTTAPAPGSTAPAQPSHSPTTSPPQDPTMKPPSGTPTAAPTSSGPAPTSTSTSTSSNPLPPTGTGCAAHPSSCGYPDASNTGPRAGVALRAVPGQVSQGTGWHWDTRGWLAADGDGAVLDGLTIPNNLNISASNVTVRNVRVIESGEGFGISLRHAQNVTIEDSEIFSPAGSTRLMVGIKDIYGD